MLLQAATNPANIDAISQTGIFGALVVMIVRMWMTERKKTTNSKAPEECRNAMAAIVAELKEVSKQQAVCLGWHGPNQAGVQTWKLGPEIKAALEDLTRKQAELVSCIHTHVKTVRDRHDRIEEKMDKMLDKSDQRRTKT